VAAIHTLGPWPSFAKPSSVDQADEGKDRTRVGEYLARKNIGRHVPMVVKDSLEDRAQVEGCVEPAIDEPVLR
jgi:hypothetical protein